MKRNRVEHPSKAKPLTATALVGNRHGYFEDPSLRGSALVIDMPDLTYDQGQAMLALEPQAVLNASPSRSGRNPATGTRVLVEAGVPVIDNLGSEAMGAFDGQAVTIAGSDVTFEGGRPLTGRVVNIEDLEASDDLLRLAARIESYALSSWNSFENEADLILHGSGLPSLQTKTANRVALIIPPSAATRDIKRLLRLMAKYDPVYIGVGAGAALLADAGKTPDIVVAHPAQVPTDVLVEARDVIIPASTSDEEKNVLKQHSVVHSTISTGLSQMDTALLLGYFGEASLLVDGSGPTSVEEYFDRDAQEMIGSMLTRIQVQDVMASADAVSALHRPPISTVWLLVLLFVALLAAGASIAFTPWGVSAVQQLFLGGSIG